MIGSSKSGRPTPPIELRPAAAEDDEFQLELYATTRAEELAIVPWTVEQRAAFLRMQFAAQTTSYRMRFPAAEWSIILRDGVRAGRLIVERGPAEIRLIDIALLPEHRGLGTGTTLVTALQAEAARENKPLRLHVEARNRARRLYERLRFRPLAQRGLYLELEWWPDRAPDAPRAT